MKVLRVVGSVIALAGPFACCVARDGRPKFVRFGLPSRLCVAKDAA